MHDSFLEKKENEPKHDAHDEHSEHSDLELYRPAASEGSMLFFLTPLGLAIMEQAQGEMEDLQDDLKITMLRVEEKKVVTDVQVTVDKNPPVVGRGMASPSRWQESFLNKKAEEMISFYMTMLKKRRARVMLKYDRLGKTSTIMEHLQGYITQHKEASLPVLYNSRPVQGKVENLGEDLRITMGQMEENKVAMALRNYLKVLHALASGSKDTRHTARVLQHHHVTDEMGGVRANEGLGGGC